MFLAATTTTTSFTGGGTVLVVILVIGWAVLRASGPLSTREPDASDEQIKVWALEACEALKNRWSQGDGPVSIEQWFSAQTFANHVRDSERVRQCFVELGALPFDDEYLGMAYKPSIGLQQRRVEDELRQLREKIATPSVSVGSGSFVQVGEKLSASNVTFEPTVTSEQTDIQTITPSQDEALIALITVLKGLVERSDLDEDSRAKARAFAHDIEVAKRVDPQDTPSLLKRIKTWADGIGAVAQNVTLAVTAIHALGIPLAF